MKLKYSFEIVDLGDEFVAVPVGEDSKSIHCVLKLNKEGLEILDILKEEVSKEDIENRLAAKYDNDASTLKEYVQSVINVLSDHDLI